jgi:hypothetical protein
VPAALGGTVLVASIPVLLGISLLAGVLIAATVAVLTGLAARRILRTP